jgi:hypothetical protein
MRNIPIDHPSALSAKIQWRDGMRTLSVFTDLDLSEDANGNLSPDIERLVERAFEARDLYFPSIKRVDVVSATARSSRM